MIEIMPQDKHKLPNVYPERFIENVKQYQDSLWQMESSPEQAKGKKK